MKKSLLSFTLLFFSGILMAQRLTTSSAVVGFDATTPKDALVKADNKTVIGSFDKSSGALAFEVAVNNFSFSNKTLQEHFNSENWMNSSNFPKFTFTGRITKLKEVKFNKNGSYDVTVSGNLTVKGITKPVTAPAKIIVKDKSLNATASFTIKLADYEIAGQPIENGKIAKEPKIVVNAVF